MVVVQVCDSNEADTQERGMLVPIPSLLDADALGFTGWSSGLSL